MMPKFLYPRARDHAFDEVCEQIVRALERRHFEAPGIKVEFGTYGSGEQWMRKVRRVIGSDFSLYFSRDQGPLPDGIYSDSAAVNTVAIPREQITVYGDNSGPTYYAYVGDDWKRDREWFFLKSCFVNSKLGGEARRYLRYSGSDETGRQVRYGSSQGNTFIYKERAKYLLHTNDLGREYDPGPDDEPFYRTSEVIDRMAAHLKKELEKIEETPERDTPFRFEQEPDAPVEGCPEFWTYADNRQAKRIREGQANVEELPLARRYALSGGYRLLAYSVPADGLGIDADVLHSGYIWSSLEPDGVPDNARDSWDNHLVRIRPKRANDVYVVDEAAYDRRRAELSAKIDEENQDKSADDKRTRFTNAEVNEMSRSRARTLTPWNDYRGGFDRPVVIIGRELGFDEVKIIETSSK